jgi:hypothetical protein
VGARIWNGDEDVASPFRVEDRSFLRFEADRMNRIHGMLS